MPFQEQLGVQLRTATPRRAMRRRQSQRRVGGLAIIVVAIAAVIGLPGLGGQQPAAAAVRVIHRPGLVGLAIDGQEVDFSKITAAAKEAGVRIRLLPRPVGPTLVGRFIAWQVATPSADVHIVGAKDAYFRGFLVPEDWDAVLDIEVGRPAQAGEAYAKVSSAVARGESLECTAVIGATPKAAASAADAEGLRVAWIGFADGATARPVATQEALGPSWRGYRVANAKALAADWVQFDLTKDGRMPDGTMAEQPDC